MKTNTVMDREVPSGGTLDVDVQEQDTDKNALRVHVIATTVDGTVGALRVANTLASKLSAQITLLALEEVPWPRPLRESPLGTMTIQKRLRGLVEEAGIFAQEVSINVCFCRYEWHRLRRILPPHSLIVVGGCSHWWSRREKKLAKYLSDLGHQVVFAREGAAAK